MAEIGNVSGNVSILLPFASVLGVQGYTALVSVLLVLLVPPQLFLSTLTIAGLCTGKTFRKIKAQRNLMIGIAAMGFVSSMILLMYAIAEYLFLNHKKDTGVVFCHAATLFYQINSGMRIYLLASLSVIVLIIIRYGSEKIRMIYLNIALFVMFAVVFLLGIIYFFPSAVNFSFQLDGVLCLSNILPGGYVGIGLSLALIDIPSRLISIGVVIASVVFIKKYSLNEDKKLKVAMVKFMVLLVILNVIVFIATYIALIPFLLLSTYQDQFDLKGLAIFRQLTDFILPSVPAIVTPLMMIAVFRPLRVAIKRLPPFHCVFNDEDKDDT
jgi:hypothetical protein